MTAGERIALRIDAHHKRQIARAAKKQNVSTSELIKRAVDHYLRFLSYEEMETITLTREEFSKLRLHLLADAKPNEHLEMAAEAYKVFKRSKDKRTKL